MRYNIIRQPDSSVEIVLGIPGTRPLNLFGNRYYPPSTALKNLIFARTCKQRCTAGIEHVASFVDTLRLQPAHVLLKRHDTCPWGVREGIKWKLSLLSTSR